MVKANRVLSSVNEMLSPVLSIGGIYSFLIPESLCIRCTQSNYNKRTQLRLQTDKTNFRFFLDFLQVSAKYFMTMLQMTSCCSAYKNYVWNILNCVY